MSILDDSQFRRDYSESQIPLSGSDKSEIVEAKNDVIQEARLLFRRIFAGITLFDFEKKNSGDAVVTEDQFIAALEKMLKAASRLYKNELLQGERVGFNGAELLQELMKIMSLFREHGYKLTDKIAGNAYLQGNLQYWQDFFRSETYDFFATRKALITFAVKKSKDCRAHLGYKHELFLKYRGDERLQNISDDTLLSMIFWHGDIETYLNDMLQFFEELPQEEKAIIELSPRNKFHIYDEKGEAGIKNLIQNYIDVLKEVEGISLIPPAQILAYLTVTPEVNDCVNHIKACVDRVETIVEDTERFPEFSQYSVTNKLQMAAFARWKNFDPEKIITTFRELKDRCNEDYSSLLAVCIAYCGDTKLVCNHTIISKNKPTTSPNRNPFRYTNRRG